MPEYQTIREEKSPQTVDCPYHGRLRLYHANSANNKRALDILLTLILAPVFVPLILMLALIVRFDGGPAFFGHARVGRDGKPFMCWKIRTMVPDAETKLAAYLEDNADAKAEWHEARKLRSDPRITFTGSFLRQTSLDELPQIWNVARGDMSFVGPRPIVESELELYGENQIAYTALRPGITGLWQISGRNDVQYAERVRLDKEYHETMSLRKDLTILVKTAGVVLRRTGH
ncbi:sugar transferase [Ruegeria arenilitoris]|uniref:sugar transferase n=1 Tax=Ruegeria arenilitoris TaxID=1173585 RepID=UPI00147AD0F0|nr:sugar transferase [Ruegeria arenilitoris]